MMTSLYCIVNIVCKRFVKILLRTQAAYCARVYAALSAAAKS